MSKYTVINAMKSGEFDGKYGKTFKYLVQLKDETGNEVTAEVNQKPDSPVPTGEINGTIETTQYGNKFKKEQTGGTFGGGAPRNDPATRLEIIRQNSLTNAVAYCTAKANLMPQKEALKFLTGKEIIQVATYFAKYSQGLVTVVNDPEPVEEQVNAEDIAAPEELDPNDPVFDKE